jgi:hypothetical protein
MKTILLLLLPLIVTGQIYVTPIVPTFIQVYNANYCLSENIIGDTTLCFEFNPNQTEGYIYVAYSSNQNGQLNISEINQYQDTILIQQGNYIQLSNDTLTICFTLVNSYLDNFCPYYIPYLALAVNFGLLQAEHQNGYLIVKWSTMSEINSNYFDVMLSSDMVSWRKIGTKKSFGNTSTEQNYFIHLPFNYSGVWYIQILEYDYNGEMTISQPTYFQSVQIVIDTIKYDLAGRLIR